MNTETINLPAVIEAVPKLVGILEPLSIDARARAISAAMTILGQPVAGHVAAPQSVQPTTQSINPGGMLGISPRASVWVARNGITREQLDHIFSIDENGVEVIASSMPGKSKRQQTVQAFVLCGLKSFLLAGELSFTDKEARQLCEKVGCYDVANHSNYMKAFDNLLAGSREAGWRLTNPGLSQAAAIVKELTTEVEK